LQPAAPAGRSAAGNLWASTPSGDEHQADVVRRALHRAGFEIMASGEVTLDYRISITTAAPFEQAA